MNEENDGKENETEDVEDGAENVESRKFIRECVHEDAEDTRIHDNSKPARTC